MNKYPDIQVPILGTKVINGKLHYIVNTQDILNLQKQNNEIRAHIALKKHNIKMMEIANTTLLTGAPK